MSKSFSVYEAKSKLSELLRLVKSGVSVIVTERGKPIAQLNPIPTDDTFEAKYEGLIKSGAVKPRQKGLFPKGKKVKGALSTFLKDRE